MNDKTAMPTPLTNARNIGPVTARELATLGIESLEELSALGWRKACMLYASAYPNRANANAFAAILGAVEDKDWRAVDIAPIRALLHRLKSNKR